MLPKHPGEMTLTRETHFLTDFNKRQLLVMQQLLGFLNPALHYILMRCKSYRLLEQTGKVIRTHPHSISNFSQR
jgi:hypothetical protein